MRMKKSILIIVILLLIVASIYLFIRKPTVNEIIDTSVSQQAEKNEEIEIHNENGKNQILDERESIENERLAPVTEQLKVMITDTVKSAVDFFKKDIYITAIGDSLTKGVGDSTNQGGYIGILDKTINHTDKIVEFNNFGKSGNRTDQLLKRLENPEVIDSIAKSDIVLVTIGANDIMLVVKENITNLVYTKFVDERNQFEGRLDEIIESIENINLNTHIYILGFYNPFQKYFPEVEELNEIVDDWNETGQLVTNEHENATFVPIKDLFDHAEIELFADDHFHPNKSGYQLMAERVLDYLIDKER